MRNHVARIASVIYEMVNGDSDPVHMWPVLCLQQQTFSAVSSGTRKSVGLTGGNGAMNVTDPPNNATVPGTGNGNPASTVPSGDFGRTNEVWWSVLRLSFSVGILA